MIVRAQVSVAMDSLLPRDRLVITPHFEIAQGVIFSGADHTQLATDMANLIGDWMVAPDSREVNVKIYDAQGTQPVFPEADVTINTGAFTTSKAPRELALCLSYYSQRNRPRYRGRLYIPITLMVSAAGAWSGSARPNAADMTKTVALAPLFASLGGVNVDWVVYSRVDDDARKVSNYYCDDEFDVVRSRGLRPTTRNANTTGG